MTDLDDKALEREFRRQLYLCKGLGRDRMEAIMKDAFENGIRKYICPKCNRVGDFLRGHICDG